MRYLQHFFLLILALAFLVPAQAGSASRTALVIGNADYKSSPLRNPANDAGDIADTLRDLDFEVIEEINSGRREMETAVNRFHRNLNKSRVGLFYYAGHGMQIDGANYLLPVDIQASSPADIKYRAVKADWILAKMKDAGSRVNIMILDACRDNPFRGLRGAGSGLAPTQGVRGSFIAYATSPGKAAADGSGRNGIYTKHLLRNIRKPELAVEEVFRKVRKGVAEETNYKQVPWDSSSLMGAFYLAGGSVVQDQALSGVSSLGSLVVESSPAGAGIRVNGRYRGEAPVQISGMKPGDYRVQAEKKGYADQEQEVRVRAGRSSKVKLYLDKKDNSGRLYVHTTPEDARVRIMNIGPPYHDGIKLAPGSYDIRVDKEGYEGEEQSERLAAGQDLEVYISLKKEHSTRPATGGSQGENWGTVTSRDSGSAPRGWSWTEPATGMEFVWVEGGCYEMGQPEAEKRYLIDEVGEEKYKKYYDDEKPRHEVCVDGFYMGKYEVTNRQYRMFDQDHSSESYKGHSLNGGNQPVVYVSWKDTQKYVKWLNRETGKAFRLPTEAEWEYAARGGTESIRYWGNDDDHDHACEYASVADRAAKQEWSGWTLHDCDDGYVVSAPVGSFRPNHFGLYDMLGNVWEWCRDWYDSDYYQNSPRHNPKGPSSGSDRVFRGGSWSFAPRRVRAADRYGYRPGETYDFLGFRLVLPSAR